MTASPPRTPLLLKKQEVADVLGVSERYVQRLISEGRISHVRLGRFVRIPEDALTSYIDARMQPAINRVPRRRRAA